MRPVKRGIAMSQEMAAKIYHFSRVAKVSENRVINRMLEISHEALAAFDDAGLRRIFTQPWEIARKLPSLSRQMAGRRSRLVAVVGARLSAQQRTALEELARKHRTTMSAIQRQTIERLLAKALEA